jgi:hypothetical protein
MNKRYQPPPNFCLKLAGWLLKGIYLFSLSFIVLHLVLLVLGMRLPTELFLGFLARLSITTAALFIIGACWAALFDR